MAPKEPISTHEHASPPRYFVEGLGPYPTDGSNADRDAWWDLARDIAYPLSDAPPDPGPYPQTGSAEEQLTWCRADSYRSRWYDDRANYGHDIERYMAEDEASSPMAPEP